MLSQNITFETSNWCHKVVVMEKEVDRDSIFGKSFLFAYNIIHYSCFMFLNSISILIELPMCK